MPQASAAISINLSCLETTLLPLVKLGVQQDPQALSAKLLSSWVALSCELMTRMAFSEGQRFAFPLVEPLDVPVGPFLWPAEVPLAGNTTVCCLSRSSEMCAIRKAAEGALCLITTQIVDLEQN